MGVLNTITRSKDDLKKPKRKSYWDFNLKVDLININDIRKKKEPFPTEKRALAHELSGIEPVQEVIFVDRCYKSKILTSPQMKEIFDDMGFNVDPIMSKLFSCDFSAVMNINGFLIPGWGWFARKIANLFPWLEKLLFTKLSPGKERLHIRAFHNNDGSWFIAAHTDWNWMDINLFKSLKAHTKAGAGNYHLGTIIMFDMLKKFNECIKNNKIFSLKNINRLVRQAYYKNLLEELKIRLRLNKNYAL